MRLEIHPEYSQIKATCSCGNVILIKSTLKEDISLEELAHRLRVHSIRMTHFAKASHIGSALSTVELLAVLYRKILRVDPMNPDWLERDRFILSKGHGCLALYAILADKGFFPIEELADKAYAV